MKQNLIDKYCPLTVDEMVLDKETKDVIKSYLDKKTIGSFTFTGINGIGKTSLAKIIAKTLNAETLFVNASVDRGVDIVRNKIASFCEVYVPDKLKIVICDEADYMSQDAFAAMRNIINLNQDDTQWILTCNFINKIPDPILSRCIPFNVNFSIEDVIKHITMIIKNEKIEVTKETLVAFINNVIKKCFPDIRRILNELELMSMNGKLEIIDVIRQKNSKELIDFILNEKNPRTIREYLIQNSDQFNTNYVSLAQDLFNCTQNPIAQNIIGEALFHMAFVMDIEIEFSVMMNKLKEIK